ncbi:pro-MCH [Callorhinchus milii]|uniref:pro-MCH n=1 Tax=Callorhinchus milii TaxID=7868 RepID=UPI001C3FF575|nr:pro-MCH [Callorhinchus milii]
MTVSVYTVLFISVLVITKLSASAKSVEWLQENKVQPNNFNPKKPDLPVKAMASLLFNHYPLLDDKLNPEVFVITDLGYKSDWKIIQDHLNFANQSLLKSTPPLKATVKQPPYFVIKGAGKSELSDNIQQTETTEARRGSGDMEGISKFPVTRRDFDSFNICHKNVLPHAR